MRNQCWLTACLITVLMGCTAIVGAAENLLTNPQFEAETNGVRIPGWDVRGYAMGELQAQPKTDFTWNIVGELGRNKTSGLKVTNLTGKAAVSIVTSPITFSAEQGPYHFSVWLRSGNEPVRLRFFVLTDKFQVLSREHLFAAPDWRRFTWKGAAMGTYLLRIDLVSPGELYLDDAELHGEVKEPSVFIGYRRSATPGPDALTFDIDANRPGAALPDFHGVCYLQGYSGPQLPESFRELPFRVVRNHNVLSHLGLVKRDADGNLRYDWARFDATIDDILSFGAVPHMSLNFVPLALVRNPDPAKVLYNLFYTGPPTDLAEWEEYIFQVVRHCREKYDIARWTWVVGNEPELPQFSMGNQQQFFDLYQASVRGAMRAYPEVQIGAGAFLTDKVWLRDFVNRCAAQRVPLRLLTWHEYGTLPEELGLSVAESRSILNRAGYTTTRLAVDEWNVVEDGRVSHNVDERGAANIMASVKAWIDSGDLDFHTYFISRDNSRPGFGLIARQTDVKHPTFNAFKMLGLARGRRLPVSSSAPDEPYVDVLASRDEKSSRVHVIVWYYKHHKDLSPDKPKEVTLRLKGLKNKQREAETHLIDSVHSNDFRQPERQELESGPRVPLVGRGDSVYTTFTLLPNSVMLLTIPDK